MDKKELDQKLKENTQKMWKNYEEDLREYKKTKLTAIIVGVINPLSLTISIPVLRRQRDMMNFHKALAVLGEVGQKL